MVIKIVDIEYVVKDLFVGLQSPVLSKHYIITQKSFSTFFKDFSKNQLMDWTWTLNLRKTAKSEQLSSHQHKGVSHPLNSAQQI